MDKYKKLNTKYRDIQIKQHLKAKYLECLLEETMSEKTMARNAVNKINSKLKILYRKNISFDTIAEMFTLLCVNTAPF